MNALWRWTVEAAARDETDALIVGDLLAETIRDERNDPDEPVRVTLEQVDPHTV